MSHTTRRAFVSTVAAAAVAPALGSIPSGPAPIPAGAAPTPRKPRQAHQGGDLTLWGKFDEDGDLHDICPTRAIAEWSAKVDCSPVKPVRCSMAGSHFRVVGIVSNDYPTHVFMAALAANADKHGGICPEKTADGSVAWIVAHTGLPEARVWADVRACQQDYSLRLPPLPDHVLAQPDPAYIRFSSQDTEDDDRFTTRGEALAAVARRNRMILAELDGDWPSEWVVAIEIGQPIATMDGINFQLSCGVGVAELRVHYPIRLVVPTAEEIERLAYAPAEAD